MSARPTCEEVQALTSEVALGVASGDERAQVLAHTKSCADCRREMEELSATADALLLLGPVHEPSSGFESNVLAKIQSAQRPPRRTRWLVAAAAVASVLLTGAAAFWLTSEDRDLATHYRDALAVADGEYFGVRPVNDEAGNRSGHLFAYEGDPNWVFFIFDSPPEAGAYEAELVTDAGDIMSFGIAEIDDGDVTWGRDIPVSLHDLQAVRLVDGRGRPVAEATFPR